MRKATIHPTIHSASQRTREENKHSLRRSLMQSVRRTASHSEKHIPQTHKLTCSPSKPVNLSVSQFVSQLLNRRVREKFRQSDSSPVNKSATQPTKQHQEIARLRYWVEKKQKKNLPTSISHHETHNNRTEALTEVEIIRFTRDSRHPIRLRALVFAYVMVIVMQMKRTRAARVG